TAPADLVVTTLAGGGSPEVIRELRQRAGRADLPVLVLAGQEEAESSLASLTAEAADYLATPFSPPMLRSRVHAWLSRTSAQAARIVTKTDAANAPDIRARPSPEELEKRLSAV